MASKLVPAARAAYTGPLKAVIFDWAGTIVDYGSSAPVKAFQQVFAQEGVAIDVATARGPMGTNKRQHIESILAYPQVQAAWKAAKGSEASVADVDRMYAAFTPLQIEAAKKRCQPIPGALDCCAYLRERGIAIGSCSGYNDEIMAAVMAGAKGYGLEVDAMECAKPTTGRPKPWMSTRVAEALDAYPLFACVKVDDTVPGIHEGVNAGMWAVGVARSGNELGLDWDEAADLERRDPAGFKARLVKARDNLAKAGAHYVIDSVAELPEVLDSIKEQLAQGNRP